jgi:hypothetical protein
MGFKVNTRVKMHVTVDCKPARTLHITVDKPLGVNLAATNVSVTAGMKMSVAKLDTRLTDLQR